MKIKTYEEFLKLTVKEVNDLIHDVVRKNKISEARDFAKWIAKVQTEHIYNSVNFKLENCKNLYEYAYGNKENK